MFFSFSHVVFLTHLPLVIKPEMVCIVLPIYNLMTVTCGGFVGSFWDSSDHKKYICYGYPTLIGVYGVIFFAGQQLDEGPFQMGIFIVFAMIGGLTFLGLFVTAVPIIAVFWEQDMDIAVGFVDFFRMMGQLAALAVGALQRATMKTAFAVTAAIALVVSVRWTNWLLRVQI